MGQPRLGAFFQNCKVHGEIHNYTKTGQATKCNVTNNESELHSNEET